MRLSELELNLDFIKITDLENIFNVYQDKNNNYFYNLNSTVYINANNDTLRTYICNYEMHWPLISYKLYGTTRLAWLLLKINNVQPKDIFKTKKPGDSIKYLTNESVNNLIQQLMEF